MSTEIEYAVDQLKHRSKSLFTLGSALVFGDIVSQSLSNSLRGSIVLDMIGFVGTSLLGLSLLDHRNYKKLIANSKRE